MELAVTLGSQAHIAVLAGHPDTVALLESAGHQDIRDFQVSREILDSLVSRDILVLLDIED